MFSTTERAEDGNLIREKNILRHSSPYRFKSNLFEVIKGGAPLKQMTLFRGPPGNAGRDRGRKWNCESLKLLTAKASRRAQLCAFQMKLDGEPNCIFIKEFKVRTQLLAPNERRLPHIAVPSHKRSGEKL